MRLLITDLDNTLYDWVTYFAHAFQALVKELSMMVEVDEEQLLDEFKAIHQQYKNSEHPFATLELPSVRKKFGNLSKPELLQVLDPPLSAFNKARNTYLQLYPGVSSTLKTLREDGVVVVGHTEAIAENALYRLRKLGIVDLFHHIYALEGHLEPHPDPKRQVYHSIPLHLIESVPQQERKPNPKLIFDICKREGVRPDEVWYVGDSLTRDISMAQKAGVKSIWARYGTHYDPSLWKILVRITHWTEEDVRRESELRKLAEGIQPDFTIDRFSDILALFESHQRATVQLQHM